VDWTGFLIVAIIVIAGIALIARRVGSDKRTDRGPFSSAMEARGGFAALGTTIDKPPAPEPKDEPDSDRARDE
jgi:hypothetical protein